MWTWGYGKHSQLGLGSNTSTWTPPQAPGLTGIVQIAANGDNTYALKSDGTVYAWGDGGYGQIGNTSAGNNQNTPLQANISDVTAIAAGGTAAMAIKPTARCGPGVITTPASSATARPALIAVGTSLPPRS